MGKIIYQFCWWFLAVGLVFQSVPAFLRRFYMGRLAQGRAGSDTVINIDKADPSGFIAFANQSRSGAKSAD